jgi:hypothetical protein
MTPEDFFRAATDEERESIRLPTEEDFLEALAEGARQRAIVESLDGWVMPPGRFR